MRTCVVSPSVCTAGELETMARALLAPSERCERECHAMSTICNSAPRVPNSDEEPNPNGSHIASAQRLPSRHRYLDQLGAHAASGAVKLFLRQTLLAKHDENYVPRELQEMEQHQAAKMAEETTVGLE